MELPKTSENVYCIYATPSDSYHGAHVVAYFATYQEAKERLCAPSYDGDDHVTWTYTIRPVDISDKSYYEKKLGQVPDHYPYTGW